MVMTETRKSSGNRPPLREKLIIYYNQIFKGEDPSKNNPAFWDEFFLLWVNISRLEEEILTLTPAQIIQLKPMINTLSRQCIITSREQTTIRTFNALQTLRGLIRGVVRKTSGGLGFDAIDVLFGFDRAETLIKLVVERVCELLITDCPASLKSLALKFLLTLVTSVDNINENTLLEYLLINSVFEAVIQILGTPPLRQAHGKECVLLLTLLANYRKHEGVNPYIVKLSILDDELALNGYSHVISRTLAQHNRRFREKLASSEARGGVFSSFTNMVGSLFVAEEASLDVVNTDESLLLAMYEAVHLNRNFITTLTSLPAELNGEVGSESGDYSANLLVAFLTYFSVIMQDLRTERSRNACKLCMITMTCIVEDQYANTLMHDVNMAFRVPLYRAPMRHRKGAFDGNPPLRPLACTVLDLMVEFILSHMMKNLPLQLYMWTLGVIHRILSYEKKCRTRLNYCWRELWNALVALLRFLVQNESSLIHGHDIFQLFHKTTTLLNLFITFGDTFLPSPASYDFLYYEIVRQSEVFGNLHSLVLRYLNSENPSRDAATRLGNQLINIRSIIGHFKPKIDQLGFTAVTEDQVLEIVRANYDTLTLKLYENLDVCERYNERPKQSSFMVQLVKLIVEETRNKLEKHPLCHQTVLNELSTIG